MLTQLRALGMAVAAACAGGALYELQVVGRETYAWWLLLAGLAIATAAQVGLRYPGLDPAPPPLPASPARRWIGLAIALGGAALWTVATLRIYRNWAAGFDFAWMGWTGAAALMAIGLDLAWGIWPRPPQRRWGGGILLAMVVLLAVAAVYRLGNIKEFPGEAAITQIEDLQVGNFGWAYLNGYRVRWEYLSSTWLAALGIWLGGPHQWAMRMPFAVVSVLKVLPLFLWLRLAVGTAGALTGTALLTFSFWDVLLSRIPNNHNTLIVAIVFSLLAGPVRRGRPSAFVLLGFFSGYILHEYVAYRPLAAFALAGAFVWSLRDRAAGWGWRLLRPLITVAVLATMVTPLFLTRIPGNLRVEYFDGWNRARGIVGYYNPNDTWSQSLQRRVDRAANVVRLFTVRGDSSPVRNITGQPPLIDPVTCALLLLGIAATAANLWRPVYALTLLGLLVTVSGTLILTGNFDVARVGGAVPYVYALAGFGAAGIWSAWSRAWGRFGRALALLGLSVAVAGAAYWCTASLRELWTNPVIRRAHRNNLAYLTIWLRDHQMGNERVLGIAPGFDNALLGHDGSWLRGRQIDGYIGWDIESTLRRWLKEPGPTLLFVYAGRSTEAITRYLETLFPQLKFQIDVDPLDLQADVAWARVPGPPPELARRLLDWNCRGVHAEYSLVGTKSTDILYKIDVVAPFICKSTWPASVPDRLYRLATRPDSIQARYVSPFRVEKGGDYLFSLETYAGSGTLMIDGVKRDSYAHNPVPLAPGMHDLEVQATFAPMAWEPVIRLVWSGPDTDQRQELMPFYRLAPLDPRCADREEEAPEGTVAKPARTYLTNWLTLGPFDSPNDSGLERDFIDVAQLSLDPQAAAAAGRHWEPMPVRDAFVDLDGFYAPQSIDRNPEWVCAYAATTVTADAATRAYLELSGSGDALQVWLNGLSLTPAPLTARYEALRRPIDLRAGANLLVIKSCEQVGAWYFVARITDAAGRDLPAVHTAAALPTEPIPLAVAAPQEVPQLIDGFAEVLAAPNLSRPYDDYRGNTHSSWTYVNDAVPEVSWKTPPVAERRPTIAALTVSTSPEDGEAQLFVNGRSALPFQIGTHSVGGHWSANGYGVSFVSKGFYAGNSGILLISVPPEAVTPGEPLQFRVRLTSGAPRAWFMIKSYPDTVAHEQMTARTAAAELHALWEPAPN